MGQPCQVPTAAAPGVLGRLDQSVVPGQKANVSPGSFLEIQDLGLYDRPT